MPEQVNTQPAEVPTASPQPAQAQPPEPKPEPAEQSSPFWIIRLNRPFAPPIWVDWLLVLGIIALVAWSNIGWAAADKGPPPSDGNTHAYHSILFHYTCQNVSSVGQSLYQFLTFRNHYPPLSYQIGELGYTLMGSTEIAYIVGMIPFTLILGCSMYLLCRHLSGRIAGIIGATISITTPSILEYSRLPFIDMQVAALVALALCAIFTCQGFSLHGKSLLAGLGVGLGMLAKWTFPIFIIIPLIYAFGQAVWHTTKAQLLRGLAVLGVCLSLGWAEALIFVPNYQSPYNGPGFTPVAMWLSSVIVAFLLIKLIHRGEPNRSPLSNAFEALLVTIAIIGPWYGNNRWQISYKALYQAGVEVDFYATLLRNCQMQITWLYLSTLWVPLGLILGLLHRQSRTSIILLVLCWGLSVASLSAAPSDDRYLLPAVVYLVAIGLSFVYYLKEYGILALVFFSSIGLAQAFYYNLESPPTWLPLEVAYNAQPYRISKVPAIPMAPRTGVYPYTELLSKFTWSKRVSWTGLLVASPQSEACILQPRSLLYYAALQQQRLRIREVLAPGQQEGQLYDEGQAINYMLMYPTFQSDGSSQAAGPQAGSHRLYIPGDPLTRQEVLEKASLDPAFPAEVTSIAVFEFGSGTTCELVAPVEDSPKNQAFRKYMRQLKANKPKFKLKAD